MPDLFPKETHERFMNRCETFFPHDKCVEVGIVYILAKFSLRHDFRKDEIDANGKPVRSFEHSRRVALLFFDEIALTDPEIIMLSLLHDTVGDTRLLPEAITKVCGPENGKRVMLMSKIMKDGFIQRLIDHGDYKTLMVKMADRIDNLRTLKRSSPEFIRKQVSETRRVYYPLLGILMERTPPDKIEYAKKLQRLLLEATDLAEGWLNVVNVAVPG